ncbi:hypothetical protein, partial [Pseudomonas palleroniana]
LWLTLPLAGCVEDFHLPVTSVATTAKLVALARNAPCLAHQKEGPRNAGLFSFILRDSSGASALATGFNVASQY